ATTRVLAAPFWPEQKVPAFPCIASCIRFRPAWGRHEGIVHETAHVAERSGAAADLSGSGNAPRLSDGLASAPGRVGPIDAGEAASGLGLRRARGPAQQSRRSRPADRLSGGPRRSGHEL